MAGCPAALARKPYYRAISRICIYNRPARIYNGPSVVRPWSILARIPYRL
jgi:hypothetical protein